MVNVAYGVCTNSWERMSQYIAPRIGNRHLIVLWNQTAIAEAYNQILASFTHKNLDMLILMHDDLELIDSEGEAKFLQAIQGPEVAIAGVAGGKGVASLAWWNHETIGYQLIDSGPLNFGPREGDVDIVEGSIMAFSPWAISNLRFDEELTGFHGYDEICMAAKRAGKRVVVANVDTHHHTRLGFETPEDQDKWFRGNEAFIRKYIHEEKRMQ